MISGSRLRPGLKSRLKSPTSTHRQRRIQVENPVAVLDQEEAKKFLCGKPEDKYAFFSKATELERLDRQYASIYDQIEEIHENKAKVERSLLPKKEIVEKLKKEWEQFEILDKMEDKVSVYRVKCAWSLYWECKNKEDEARQNMKIVDDKLVKRREELAKAESTATSDSNEEEELDQKMKEFTAEADEASETLIKQETKLKNAKQPLKQHMRSLQTFGKEKTAAKRRLKSAKDELKKIQDEIVRKAGSAKSEETRRIQKKMEAEEELSKWKEGEDERNRAIHEAFKQYEEKELPEQSSKEDLNSARRQINAVQGKLQGLKSSEGNSMAMFGNKCVNMHQKVEKALRDRRFHGPVHGPIGHYLKVVDGKEHLAALATSALKIGLDRFIVTNDHDRSLFMKLRNEIRCNSRQCLVIQTNEGPRYNVKQPPEGVETAATVITVSNDLVFNCLVDSGRIDQLALMNLKEASQQALLLDNNGKSSIRGGVIKEVHFLPDGDYWQVFNGAVSMSANSRKLKQIIGVDRTTSIRETENEIEQISMEINELSSKADNLKKIRQQYKVKWNSLQRENQRARIEMQRLEEIIDRIQEEAAAAENVTVDTTEYEDDVKEAERAFDQLKDREVEIEKVIEEMQEPIRDLEAKLQETKERNRKVASDLDKASKKYAEYMRTQQKRDNVIEKKRSKLKQIEDVYEKHMELINDRSEKTQELKQKAQKITHSISQTQKKRNRISSADGNDANKDNEDLQEDEADIESIEPVNTNKPTTFWQNKIQSGEREITKERNRRKISEVDPEVALRKYQRAKQDLEEKMAQVVAIQENQEDLVDDLKHRKKMWREFRSHISDMSNNSFDEILNTKGSSGYIDFDHKNQTLNLVVQKDNKDENTQTNDVKALSGGERSFTTLSLLLALGESLETPFRVMDEFDVFLDPVARKIALENLINTAKSMENRQFIFITPQDLSNVPTDPRLMIFCMKPPIRSNIVGGAAQQTLEFQSSQ